MTWALLLLLQTDPLEVSLPVSTPEKSHQAAVVFVDESSINKIVLGIEREAVSVDVVENRIFIKLLKPAKGHLDCITGSGMLVRLTIVNSETDPTEVLRVRTRRQPKSTELPKPLKLVRMMRTGRRHEEVRLSRLHGTVYESQTMTAAGRWLYRWETLRGYVLEIRNRTDRTISLDLSKLRGEKLLLIACQDLAVPPGGSTFLYLVFE